ncbi:CD209 antigen-like protein C isoform X2 [Melanotaenia boesemani]|uniref:CD209 antigen-like protein C isoform X2 n=1 Tax=Melanotaenia boesemani TaxID=1250792 RepID=UPI001C046D9E|nr:CD209 antigen-like protein C isoform X2 [Melanotaenia boesemani]
MERENTSAECRSLNQIPSLNDASKGSRWCKRSFHLRLIFFLGLLSVSLLAGVCILDVQYRKTIAELSSISNNLTEYLQASKKSISSLINEKIQLKILVTESSQELIRLQSSSHQEWIKFSGSYYFVSSESGTWDEGTEDCRNSEADLVVIESIKEQLFVSNLTTKQAWIGLTDREEEGTWKWVDGTPLTLKMWARAQPDNGGELPGMDNEDCAHLRTDNFWNDLSCTVPLRWICEKKMFER